MFDIKGFCLLTDSVSNAESRSFNNKPWIYYFSTGMKGEVDTFRQRLAPLLIPKVKYAFCFRAWALQNRAKCNFLICQKVSLFVSFLKRVKSDQKKKSSEIDFQALPIPKSIFKSTWKFCLFSLGAILPIYFDTFLLTWLDFLKLCACNCNYH